MKKYINPSYEKFCAETEDVILASLIDVGTGELGPIIGRESTVEFDYSELFGVR